MVYAFAAAFFWSLNIIFDKYVVDHEIEGSIVTTIFCSVSAFILIGIVSVFADAKISDISVLHLSLGGLYTAALVAYYSGMGREDVSRFTPTLSVDTIFITVISAFLFSESFGAIIYAGIISVVAGAFLISLDDPLHSLKSFQSKKGVYLAVIAAAIFAYRDLVFNYFLVEASYWTLLLGMAIGGLVSITGLSIYRREKLVESSNKGFEHLLGIGILLALGYFTYVAAINKGPVSLSSAIVKSQNLIIFGITLAIQKLHPGVKDEEISKAILIQKTTAVLLIVTGLLAITLN